MIDHHQRHWVRPKSCLGLGLVLLVALLACKKKPAEKEQAVASASPPPAPAVSPCPAAFKRLPQDQRQSMKPITCRCPAGTTSGSVWGSKVYTTDSSICRAAIHAGVISAGGGEVTVQASPGCSSYAGSEANGVRTSNWGPYETSFFFPAKGDGKCPTVEAGGPCPSSFKSIPNRTPETTFTCRCTPAQVGGRVWGTGIYTTDSSICMAAIHAGAVKGSGALGGLGAKVTVKAAPGCKSYVGSKQNGVLSGKWGPYDSSFFVVGHGDGKCSP